MNQKHRDINQEWRWQIEPMSNHPVVPLKHIQILKRKKIGPTPWSHC
jgi:hypothetical protein